MGPPPLPPHADDRAFRYMPYKLFPLVKKLL